MVTNLPVEHGATYLVLTYQSYDVVGRNSSVPHSLSYITASYQRYDVVGRNSPVPHSLSYITASYQRYEVTARNTPVVDEPTVTDTTPSGGITWIRTIVNIISYTFRGKAWVFDGTKFNEVGSPGTVVFPIVASDGEKVMVTGGITKEGLIKGEVLGYNFTYHFVVNALPKSLVCWAYGSPDIELVLADDKGTMVRTVKVAEAVLLQPWWKLISKSEFSVLCTKV